MPPYLLLAHIISAPDTSFSQGFRDYCCTSLQLESWYPYRLNDFLGDE
jgi:hypothetical protein